MTLILSLYLTWLTCGMCLSLMAALAESGLTRGRLRLDRRQLLIPGSIPACRERGTRFWGCIIRKDEGWFLALTRQLTS